jgi:poly(3-hydroxybutyrate) depolymerase
MTAHSLAPAGVDTWLSVPADTTRALLGGVTGYTASVLRRRLGPLDVAYELAEWWQVLTLREQPQWMTPHDVLTKWPQARLLDFSTVPDDHDQRPTLLLPPQAGHSSTIVDYSADQSQIRTARTAGVTRLFCLDWLPATAATAESSIGDYVAILDETTERLGGRVNLVGDCQGGWLAALYAGLRPERVAALAVAAAPIDFHAGHTAIQDWVRLLGGPTRPRGGTAFYRSLVALGGGVQPGRNQITGFKMLQPAAELERAMELLTHIDDAEYVDDYVRFTNWFEWGQDLPGAFYLWIVEHLFIDNALITSRLSVPTPTGPATVDLTRIDCPIFLLAGRRDHITPPEQVWALADHVSTPPTMISRRLVDAGHLGLFMGTAALHDHWSAVFADLAALPIG